MRQAALEQLETREWARRKHEEKRADAEFTPPDAGGTLAEMLAKPQEPLQYTIKELHPRGGSGLIAAQYKVGKTTLILNLARSWADDEPFLDEFEVSTDGGNLAIFNYELTEQQFLDYARPLGIRHPERISVLHLRGKRFDLRSPKTHEWAADWLAERDCTGLILDPFGAAARLRNENDNSEARLWLLDCVDTLKAESGVVDLWLPAHTGRGEAEEGGEHVRGASAVDDWADVRWLYTKQFEVQGDGRRYGQRYLRADGRGVALAERQIGFSQEDNSLHVSAMVSRSQGRSNGLVSSVVNVVEAEPGINSSQLRQRLPGDTKYRNEAIQKAIDLELIRVEPGKNNSKHHYPVDLKPGQTRIYP
ncbi:AAA family ATPase [Micromonospora sp. SD19]